MNIDDWTSSLLIFGGFFFAGLLIQTLLRKQMRKVAEDMVTPREHPLRGVILLWSVLLGLYFAFIKGPFQPANIVLASKILLIVFILSVTITVSRIATTLIRHHNRKQQGFLANTTIFTNLTKFFILLIGILTIFSSLGVSLTPALTALGLGGLSLAFALQDTLSSLFSGLVLASSKYIGPGDYVKLSTGEEGFVTDITWRNTVIRTPLNFMVVVPNSKLATNVFTNYHHPTKEVNVAITVGIAYDSDLEKVERITLEVAKDVLSTVPGAVSEFQPSLRFNALSDSSIDFTVVLRAKEIGDQVLVKHEFIKRLMSRYRAEDVRIPFPTRTLYIDNSKTSV